MAKKPAKKKRTAKKRKPLEPEVIQSEPTDPSELGQDVGSGSGSGPVVDVGNTLPSAPDLSGGSLPARRAVSGGSLPVPRGTGGVSRATALASFMAQLGRFPVLSPEEERELALAYFERGDANAARKLVVHNLRLVVKMAYKYRRAWASVLDLIQEGNIGLIEAVRRYDPFKGARFTTYSSYWIRAYMIRYLLEHSRMVRISRTRAGRKLFFRLSKEREKLRAQGIEAGPKLLAEKLGVSQKDFEEVSKFMDQSEVRLDAPISAADSGGGTVLDTYAAHGETPETAAHKKAIAEDVGAALDSFGRTLEDEREKAAWEEHLMSDDPVSLSALGARFGVTKQRMGQIVNGIRKRLRTHLIETLGPDVRLEFTGGH